MTLFDEIEYAVLRKSLGNDRGELALLRKRVDEMESAWNRRSSASTEAGQDGEHRTPEQIADEVVNRWNREGRMPPMAWDFRGLAADAIRTALADGVQGDGNGR